MQSEVPELCVVYNLASSMKIHKKITGPQKSSSFSLCHVVQTACCSYKHNYNIHPIISWLTY